MVISPVLSNTKYPEYRSVGARPTTIHHMHLHQRRNLLGVAKVQSETAFIWRWVMAEVACLAIVKQLAGPAAAAGPLHNDLPVSRRSQGALQSVHVLC